MNSANDGSDDSHRPPSLIKDDDLGTDIFDLESTLGSDARSPPESNQEVDLRSDCVTEEVSVSLSVEKVGDYLLLEKTTVCTGATEVRRAKHCLSEEEFVCKIFPIDKYQLILAPYFQCGEHAHINNIVEILPGETQAYVMFHSYPYQDLQKYIAGKKRGLKESEAANLFGQIVSLVKHCHQRGIILRSIHLRNLIFADQFRSHLMLDGMEHCSVLSNLDDDHIRITDQNNLIIPVYLFSPERISLARLGYSGKAADIWSLGVILYVLLTAQFPFVAAKTSILFRMISMGGYKLQPCLSLPAQCLVKCLLRTGPSQRLMVQNIRRHPWFEYARTGKAEVGARFVPILGGGRNTARVAQPSEPVAQPSEPVWSVPPETEQRVPETLKPASEQDSWFS